MKVTIDIDSENEFEKLFALFEAFKITTIKVNIPEDVEPLPITRGDKKIDPKSIFGIWASKPRNLEDIRKLGWEKGH